MRRFSPQTLIILLISVIVAGCNGTAPPAGGNGGVANQQVPPTSTPIPTAPSVARPTFLVQRGDVEQILDFTGRWQPRDQTQLAFQTAERCAASRSSAVTR